MPRGPLGRFFLTTALVTLGLASLGADALMAQQVRVLNNGTPLVDGVATQQSGTWRSEDRIWSDPGNLNEPDQLGEGDIGLLPVLVANPDGSARTVQLTLSNRITLWGLRIEGNGYSVQGSTAVGDIPALRASSSDTPLSFDIRNGAVFNVTNVALRRSANVTGNGRLVYSGDTGSNFDRMTVDNGASLELRAGSRLQGSLSNNGTADLSGRVVGEIANDGTMNLSGNFTAERGIQNNTTRQLSILSGATANVGAASNQGINNTGSVDVAGTVTGQLRNDDGGIVTISGGTADYIVNRVDTGTISGFGVINYSMNNGNGTTHVIAGANPNEDTLRVGGSLTNRSEGNIFIRSTAVLDVAGGVANEGAVAIGGEFRAATTGSDAALTNDGNIAVQSSGTLRVAGGARNLGSIISSGRLIANITNQNSLETNGGIVQGAINNSTSSSEWIAQNVTTTGNVLNAGTVDLTSTTMNGTMTSSNILNLTDSAISGAVTNTGVINLRAGTTGSNSVGSLTNSGDGRITVGAADTLRITNGQFTNSATGDSVQIQGTVIGNVRNTGVMDIGNSAAGASARIEGNLTNGSSGAGPDSGRLWIRGSTRIDGNLMNYGTITSYNSGGVRAVEIVVRDRLTNYGIIRSNPGSSTNTLTVRAAEIENYGQWLGKVKYYGKLLNGGTMELNDDQVLDYEISNLAGGTVNVSARVNADGRNISNAGNFNVLGGGNFSNANPFTNSRLLTIDRDASLSATRLDNSGTIDSNGTITAPLNNQTGGTANLSGTVTGLLTNGGTVNTTGNLSVTRLVNNREVNVRQGHTLSSGNAVTNAGVLNVAGTLDPALNNSNRTNLNGGTLVGAVENTGTIFGNGSIRGQLENRYRSTLEVSGGTLRADQTVNNVGTVRLAHTLVGNIGNHGLGAVVMTGVRENGQLVSGVQGSISNSGSVTGVGAISGTLANRGTATATIGGSVGAIDNGGTSVLTSGADLTAGTITNSRDARVIVGAGTTMSTDKGLTNNGRLTVTGTLGGNVTNVQGATTELSGTGARTISGSITNAGRLQGNGTVATDVNNGSTGDLAMTGTIGRNLNNRGVVGVTSGRLNVRGTLLNDHQVNVGAGVLAGNIRNRSQVTITGGVANGGVLGNITNDATLTANGVIQGDVVNTGRNARADLRGTVTGTITNRGTFDTLGNLRIGGLINSATARINTDHILSTTGAIRNSGNLIVNGIIRRVVAADNRNVARAPGDDAELVNESTLRGAGTINMNIRNEGRLLTTGTLGGYVENVQNATANISGTVRGRLTNAGDFATTGDLAVGLLVTSAGGESTVAQGHRLTARTTSLNEGEMTVAGTFAGALINAATGTFDLRDGSLTGSMRNNGTVNARGTIGGVVENNSSNFNLTGALTVGGFVNNSGMTIATGRTLTVASGGVYTNNDATNLAGRLAGAVQNAQGASFNLASSGVVDGTLLNQGTINVRFGRITGTLTNDGTVNMHNLSGGSSTADVLRVGGLAGNGEYSMSLNLADMTGDRIEVRGGDVTGSHHFNFSNVRGMPNRDIGNSVTVLDVDGAFRNNYTFSQTGLSGSERIVYRLIRNGDGDLQVSSAINPAIGSMLGNIMLSHSLIGTVINRPTSPYVVGMAYEDKEKSCGVGSWARGMGGNATATGAVTGPGGRVNTEIKANYYGMQVGTDMACFNGRFDGWDMAVGGLIGVNRGTTTQPIPNITLDGPGAGIASVTKSDFDQIYGGLYLTASKDRWTLDVQYRYEKTKFNLENTPIEGIGLGLLDNKFSSTANTLAGAVSYAMPVAETGWTLVPQAGFAWSKYKIDDMRFTEGYRMEFGNAERKVGFLGATVTKTFVQPSQNSAFNLYGTATYYNDFAKDTVSTFRNDRGEFVAQRLTADNLGSYTEVSIGSNYIKVLPRVGGRPRQFSAGARIDGRFGDNIDSVGVTGQFRIQF